MTAGDGSARSRVSVAPLAVAVASAALVTGCAGGVPLLHPAHVLSPGRVSVGAGVAGHVEATTNIAPKGPDHADTVLDALTVAPGVSPWGAGRIGIDGDNEAGISYLGRSFRVDGRHAFPVGPLHLSLGIGASAVVPRPDDTLGKAYGGGADVPVLLGWKSDAELYSLWFGPRAGFEILHGDALASALTDGGADDTFVPFSGKHIWVGGLVGSKVGFRSIHVALEVDVAYHFADGQFGVDGAQEASVGALTITPSGALILTL